MVITTITKQPKSISKTIQSSVVTITTTGKWKDSNIHLSEVMTMTTGNKRSITRISKIKVVWLVGVSTITGSRENIIRRKISIMKAERWDIIRMPGCKESLKLRKLFLTWMRNFLPWCKMVKLSQWKTRDLKKEKDLLLISKLRAQRVMSQRLSPFSDQEKVNYWSTG